LPRLRAASLLAVWRASLRPDGRVIALERVIALRASFSRIDAAAKPQRRRAPAWQRRGAPARQ